MVPKLHPRGSSFHGACDYILHDAEKAKTNDRVPWCLTVNLATQDPKWAWHEMVETYWAQDALKTASGIDLRGRKNKKPVLHYSLSWADSENPSPEEMQKAALSSLKALGLDDHQALISPHTDTKHPHVHIVVNLIHPTTGRSHDLKFPKLDLSRWAEAYEREHGIHCHERIKNNAARARSADRLLMDKENDADGKVPQVKGEAGITAEREERENARRQRERWLRKRTAEKLGPDKLLGNDPHKSKDSDVPSVDGWARRRKGYIAPSRILRTSTREPVPEGVPQVRKPITPEQHRARDWYRKKRNPMLVLTTPRRGVDPGVPRVVKHRSETRPNWLDKKDIIDRMKRLRAEKEVFHKIDRNATWERHKQERDALWKNTTSALAQTRDYVSKKFKPHWRDLYKAQREEFTFVEKATPLERAVFVFANERRLGGGRPLKPREKQDAITKPGRLLDLLEAAHERERTRLAQIQKAEAHVFGARIYDDYARKQDALLSRQTDERQAERERQFKESREVTFKDAKRSLIDEREARQNAERAAKARADAERNLAASQEAPAPSPAREQATGSIEQSAPAPAHRKPSEGGDAPGLSEVFDKAADPPSQSEPAPELPRSEELRRLMEEWRRNNPGRDFGREM